MMRNPGPEKEIIIKDIRNLFRLRKELKYIVFIWEKETKAMKDRILWKLL